MSDRKEAVLVSYPPMLHSGAWLREKLLESVAPHMERSVLLTDAADIHPELHKAWTQQGHSVVQYLKNGRRIVDGVPSIQSWSATLDRTSLSAKDDHEIHAFALYLALVGAQRKGFAIRSFILRGAQPDPWHVSRVLERDRADLPGYVTVIHPKPAQENKPAPEVIAWVDTETTGFDRKRCAVIEVAGILTDLSADRVLDEFDARAEVPAWALVSNGSLDMNRYYTDSRWNDKTDHATMAQRFAKWIPARCRLAGHNLSFDRSFLEETLRRYKHPVPDWYEQPIDTCVMADRYLKRAGLIHSKALSSVCQYFEIETGELHGARADIRATLAAYRKLRVYEKTPVRKSGTP